MKHTVISMLFVGMLAFFHSAHGENHLAQYAVAPKVKAILDKHSKEVYKKIKHTHKNGQWHGVYEFPWLPGYYVKYGLARIKGVERIRRCIKEHKLDLLTTPDKRVYHIKGRPTELSDLNYAIVVKAVEATDDPQPLTLEQVKQLATIIYESDYVDMTSTNYIRTKDGKLSLIDTEGIFNRKKLIKGFLRMIGTEHDLNNDYTEPALKFVFAQVKKILTEEPEWIPLALEYIQQQFEYQEKPYAWDYITYFNDSISDLEKP